MGIRSLIVAALSFAVALCAAQQSFGQCYGAPTTCCTDIDFEFLPGYNNASGQLSAGKIIEPDTFAAAGLRLWLSDTTVRPNTDGQVFPIGLINSSSIPSGETWGTLRTPREGLIATILDTLDPLRPLRSSSKVANPYTLNLSFASVAKGTLACVSSIRAIRTYDTAYRMSMQVKALDEDGGVMGSRDATWTPSLVSHKNNVIDLDISIREVASLNITWVGFGYGSLASVRFCFPSNNVDACGICGGDGSVCGLPATAAPRPGQPCVNNSMSNPVCRPGRYDPKLHCVPNLFNITQETCNGVDDDCDGVIDNGATVLPISCGVGACKRTVYQCGNESEPFNTTCIPGTPTPEVCNQIDDDCDGVIDNGHVCDRPVEGVPVTPVRVCVSGRLATPRTKCYARFGYFARDPVFNVTLPYPSDVNSLIFSPSTPALWQPSNTSSSWPPSNFTAGSHTMNAFNIEIPACSGVSAKVTWQLGDGRGNYQRADFDADTAPPCETGNYSIGTKLKLPITPLLDEPCVRRSTTGTCAVSLGYYNPNLDTPTGYVEVGAPTNYFYFTGGSAGTNADKTPVGVSMVPPPNVFFPGRVRSAYEASWLCPAGSETLHWLLTTGSRNKTIEAITMRVCSN